MKWPFNLFQSTQFSEVNSFSTTSTTSMSSITINGKTYHGNSVSIINGVVTIDGVKQTGEKLTGVVSVEITGDPASINCDAPVVVHGNVKGNVIADGPVTCRDVAGDVEADGPCTCGNVTGNVEADGPVTCGNVSGNVKADIVIHS